MLHALATLRLMSKRYLNGLIVTALWMQLAFCGFSLAASPQKGSGVNAHTPDYVLDEDTGIRLMKGFDAERIYQVPQEQGSWVAMAFDPKGRLIVSDQDDKGVFRVTLPRAGEKGEVNVEHLKGFPFDPIKWGQRRVGGALGFHYAFDSLYMSNMRGFYRIRDTDGDDQFDEFKMLKKLNVGWEHSAHSIIATEDGKGLYLVAGNYVRLPEEITTRQPPVWRMDNLLPHMPDPMGHATRIKPPGGWIAKISPDGKTFDIVATGFRNSVDMAINKAGELFTYDSDLEFDIGAPWYRPTRLNHVISGGEYGWRSGTGKWPDYFTDSFGSVLDIGPGSPTGMSFGDKSGFPADYQEKLFICDWTFGTIYMVDLKEDGASYTAAHQDFLNGSPLNITAMRFGPDGHMYFLTGGRNTLSALYRVRYVGDARKPAVQVGKNAEAARLRGIRKQLAQMHERREDGERVVAFAWPFLGHEDRAIRYAARLAVENQSPSFWRDKVMKIKVNKALKPSKEFNDSKASRLLIHAAVALARHAHLAFKDDASAMVNAGEQLLGQLNKLSLSDLDEMDQLALLRAYSLCFIRFEGLSPSARKAVASRLESNYPANTDRLNRELCRLLAYLDSPGVVSKTIKLMQQTQVKTLDYNRKVIERDEKYGRIILDAIANSPNAQNIHYAYALRRVKTGWTLATRKAYFSWLNDALKKSGGKSYLGHIKAIRHDAISHLSEDESKAVGWLVGDVVDMDQSKLPQAAGPGRAWDESSITPLFKEPLKGRNHERGQKMFLAGRCVVCHRIRGEGGYSGPDLGSVGQRYAITDILKAIIQPSLSISEQYQASDILLHNGEQAYGRVIYVNDKEVAIAPNAFEPDKLQKIARSKVKEIKPSNISMMPPGMINAMNEAEVKDLVAYLIAGGNPRHDVYKK